MAPDLQYWIASFPGELEESEVEPILHKEIDESLYGELHTLFSFAARYHLREEFVLVEENFNDFEERARSSVAPGAPDDLDQEGRRLKVMLLNWILSFRAFLDHHETHLKRTYGGDASAEFGRFKARCSEAYDQHFGYRFLYKLRNYSQHCGFPPISIHIDQTQTPPIVQPILDRDELLREYDDWGAQVREELRSTDPLIPLAPLVEEAMREVRDIETLLLDIDGPLYQKAQRQAHTIRECVNDDTHRFALAAGQLDEKGGVRKLSLRIIPRWLAAQE